MTREPAVPCSLVVPMYYESLRLAGTRPRLGDFVRQSSLPVRWRGDARTKVRLGRDVVGSRQGLMAIRASHLTGRYNLPR